MKSICLLLDGTGKFVEEGDREAAQALRARDVDVQWACWQTSGVYFHKFDMVLVRTCCGYHHKLPGFLAWLRAAAAQGTRFVNDAETVAWNSDKRYLRDLQARGVSIVPTRFVDVGESGDLAALLADAGWDEAVVKPVVSAGSQNTWRINRSTASASQERFADLCAERGMMVQPFLPEVLTEGEISLIYINGALTHCVRKVPKAGDFRVQPEFGSTIVDTPPPAAALNVASKCFAALPNKPLYARVDGVMTSVGFLLMELELIEPNLYLTGRPQATQAYVEAVMQRL